MSTRPPTKAQRKILTAIADRTDEQTPDPGVTTSSATFWDPYTVYVHWRTAQTMKRAGFVAFVYIGGPEEGTSIAITDAGRAVIGREIGPEWAVVEFDADQEPIWTSGPFTEEQARARFTYVTRERSQRSDVVLRARSAALLRRGKVVEACSVRRSTRAPLLANKRLRHLDADSRQVIISFELLAVSLARAAIRKDGKPRVGPKWASVRATAVDIWNLVRWTPKGAEGPPCSWWMQEWQCGCTQIEERRVALSGTCPYHEAPTTHAATLVKAEVDRCLR